MPIRKVICKMCSKEFETTHPRKIFCSSLCCRKDTYLRMVANGYKRNWDRNGICKHCGKQFERHTSRAEYCTPECREAETKKRKLDIYYARRCTDSNTHIGDIVRCEMCGKEFAFDKSRSLCCSKECMDAYSADLDNIKSLHGEGYRYVKYHQKKNINKNLDAKVKKAKKLGISYGQLQAKMMMAGAC